MCATHACNHSAHVPTLSASGQKHPDMCRPMLTHPACCWPACASACALTWTNVVSRARQLRSACLLRVRAAALGRLVGSVAEKHRDLKVAMHFACRGWLFAPSGGGGAAGGGGDRALDTRGARLPRGCSTGAEAARFQAHACGLWATTRPALRARGGQRVSLRVV